MPVLILTELNRMPICLYFLTIQLLKVVFTNVALFLKKIIKYTFFEENCCIYILKKYVFLNFPY